MAKIKLGARPKTFKRVIKVALPEGEEGTIEVVYRYRTKTEFGKFLDEVLAAGQVTVQATDADGVTLALADALAKTRDANADYILRVADGWNLDAEFSRETVAQLCDELPGVALAIMDQYRTACVEGRLGN
jgi:hypothetical protein